MHITKSLYRLLLLCLLLLPHISLAEYTVLTAPPFERQFIFEINPGEEAKSSIIIKNLGNTSLKTSIYAADATHSNLGTFAITSAGNEQRHIGTWVKFSDPNTIIPPKQEVEIPFIVKIPSNTTPGNYGGGIAVEATPVNTTDTFIETDSDTINKQEKTESQVKVASRLITKIFVNIPGEKQTDIKWTGFTYEPATNEHKPSFKFSLKNDGNTIIMAEPVITLSGIPPLENKEIKLSTITLQPGTEIDSIEERWEDQPLIGIYSATATINFSEFDIINNDKINPWTENRSIPLINLTPWYIIAIIVLIILGLIGIIFAYFVRKKIYINNCYQYTTNEGETIIDIAEKHNANWKKIAKINKLSAPYTLQKGQTILVPKLKK